MKKNKIYYILLSLLVSFSFMTDVFADGLDFTVSATADNNEVVVGEEATITVALKSESYINACTFKIETDSNIEEVSKSGMNNYNALGGSDALNVENASLEGDALTNGVNILTLKYKINGNGKVTIKTTECISPLDEKTGTYQDVTVNFTTKDLSQDTTLKSLTINGGVMSPTFSSNVTSYTVKLDSANFSLNMTASNADYQDDIVVTSISGETLDPSNLTFSDPSGQGMMPIYITVNNGTKYEFGVRYEQPELNNSLSSLTVNGQTVTLEPGKLDYTVKIGSGVSSVNVEAILADGNNFQFADGNGPGSFDTSGSSTTIALIIEPKSDQAGATGVTYMIEMIKEGSSGGGDEPSKEDPPKEEPSTGGNTTTNPQTGNISMFIMAVILIASLVGSVVLYQKNIESYK